MAIEERDVAQRFGPELAKLRGQYFETQSAAADALGLRPPSVWAWEKGDSLPSLARLVSFAAAAGIVLTLVIAGDGAIRIKAGERPATSRAKLMRGGKAP